MAIARSVASINYKIHRLALECLLCRVKISPKVTDY